MKSLLPLCLGVGLVSAGCAHHRPPTPPPAARTSAAPMSAEPIVTPGSSLTGRVVSYNSVGRFVVLSFPVGQMPKLNQSLFLYRNGLKVAEIKITGPQSDNNVVADLVTGEARVGDDVREQ
jgi:hypothetical protein